MKLYLAQLATHPSIIRINEDLPCRQPYRKAMKIYLAGNHTEKNGYQRIIGGGWQNLSVLESYYYVKNNIYFPKLYNKGIDLLLDSGAFTFITNKKHASINWEYYADSYADFIKSYGIRLYFELDIDSIVGYSEVQRLRNRIESRVGVPSIPVWHKTRGKQNYIDMCKEYDYVALGGIAAKEVPLRMFEKVFPWFIGIAHDNNAKIHGLGYTSLDGIKRHKFDSVDSTAWLSGSRFGAVYKFNRDTMVKYDAPKGCRVVAKETARNNFLEWVKFANYIKTS